MYQKLGRMMGRSYEETIQILIKSLRNAESLTRIEVMLAFEKVSVSVKIIHLVMRNICTTMDHYFRFVAVWERRFQIRIRKFTRQQSIV